MIGNSRCHIPLGVYMANFCFSCKYWSSRWINIIFKILKLKNIIIVGVGQCGVISLKEIFRALSFDLSIFLISTSEKTPHGFLDDFRFITAIGFFYLISLCTSFFKKIGSPSFRVPSGSCSS